ncbi:MAG TPA: NUDIX hydrolase, partial [Nitrososphaera sp.]|nr:NUDIX hydrolase [Nitrososphaera sp.]
GGKTIQKEIVEHRQSVGILPLIPRDRNGSEDVVLVTQYRRAADRVLLEIPAGKLEPGETPRQAAKREMAEEIGYGASKLEPLAKFYLAPGYDTEFMTLYVGTGLYKIERGQLDDDENILVRRLSLLSARSKCISGEIQDCKTIAAIFAYLGRHEKRES